jgi:hypothetical protein
VNGNTHTIISNSHAVKLILRREPGAF